MQNRNLDVPAKGVCRKQIIAAVLIVLFLSSCDFEATDPLESHAKAQASTTDLDAEKCAFNATEGINFKCFRATGAGIEYKVAILSRDQRKNISKAPLLVIPGGPGQGGMTSAASLERYSWRMLDEDIERDLILYEPRAAMGSSVFWRCNAYEDLSLKLAGEDISTLEEMQRLDSVLRQCLVKYDQFLKLKVNSSSGIKSLNTMTYSLDLKQLLDALPYQKIILWGTSYGTRLALASAEHNKVHRLLLDSPYPFEYGGFSDETKLLVKVPALHRIHFEKFGPEGVRYSELFLLAYERLKKQPIHAQITRWDGEPELDFVLNTDRLLALEFDALYDESLLGLYYSGLASIVDEPDALSDDLRRVLESMVTNAYTPTFSSMAYIATECNDNGMESRIEVEKALAHLDGHRFYGDYLDYFNMDLCRNKLFEQTRRINTLSYDAIQDTPTLILSGEQDPVTPEYWGRALHTKIDSAYWAGIEGLGHAVLASYLCDWSQLEVFLEKGVMNRLDCATEWLQARAVQNLVPEQN